MRFIADIFLSIFKWISARKKLVFIYIPLCVIILSGVFVAYIYMSWLSDKDAAMDTLQKYKRLIDRTEEMKKGYSYHYGDIDLKAKVVDIPTRIYDRNDEIIGEFFEQKREIIPYEYIPQALVKAVVASEDRDFYSHKGVNPRGIFRAFLKNITSFRIAQGGSTITQQLSKVLFTEGEKNMKRKIYEMFCATEIEKRYGKQEIMSMYLNLIYFGNGAYGVESASKMFFGKSVKDIGDVECAMIVATISNPKNYSPLGNLDASVKKTKRILKSMADAKFINSGTADYNYKKFLKKWDVAYDESGRAVSSLLGSFIFSSYRVNRAPFFNEMVRRVLVERFDEDTVKRGGLSVYTTIDGARQDLALSIMRKGISAQREFHLKNASKTTNARRADSERENAKNIEGALVSIDPATGEIISYVGGYEFTSGNQNDNASQMKRQPGSSIKPLVYYSALQEGDLLPSTLLKDEKTVFKGGYSPSNYDGKYLGPVTARFALVKSLNIPAVAVLEKTGYSAAFEILQKSLDMPSSEFKNRFRQTLSFALGAYEVSPVESSVVHATIINGGNFIKPYGIRIVKDYNGNIVWNAEEEIKTEIEEKRKRYGRIVKPVHAAVLVSMLRGVFEKDGTGYWSAYGKKIKFQIAGKTGTSSGYIDAWMVGYTSNSVTSIWIGNKKGNIPLGPGRSGGAIAGPVWTEYIAAAYRESTPPDFPVPEEGMTSEKICLKSGKVALKSGECPDTAVQLFSSGTEPGEYCDIHSAPAGDDAQKQN